MRKKKLGGFKVGGRFKPARSFVWEPQPRTLIQDLECPRPYHSVYPIFFRLRRFLQGQIPLLVFNIPQIVRLRRPLQGQIPSGSELLYDVDRTTGGGEPRPIVVRKRVSVSGDNLVDAQPTFQDNQPVVSLRFDAVGARKFGSLTRDNVGKRFAIVLDGAVISAPVIREAIPGGSGIISGNFTTETAQDLALLLRAGALPAPLTILEERTVGPSLGADSVAAGKVASVVGMILVISYIIISN